MNKKSYIPGTGASIIGGIWPLIIAVLSTISVFLIKYFWNPLKKTASKVLIFKKREKEKGKEE